MAKKRTPTSQISKLPEYGDVVMSLEHEAVSVITDYIRQYVGVASPKPTRGSGVYMQQDRVLNTQTYQELAFYDLYAEVERDTHIASVLDTAKLNVAGMPYDIYPYAEEEGKPSKRDQEIALFVKRAIKRIGYFPQHLYNMMDALGKGFSASELIWESDSTGHYVKNILNRPQRRIQFDAVTREPKVRNIVNPYLGDPIPDKKIIIHRTSATWDNPFGNPLSQSLYWIWLFKRMVFKFFMQHLEVGSAASPIVKHPANADDKLKSEALAIAQQIRSGAYGRIPDNFEIIWAETRSASSISQAYDSFIRLCNDEISKCVNGNVLTTDATSNAGTGSRALGEVHQGTQSLRDRFRADALAATLNATLIKWLVDLNFADVDGYPEFKFESADVKNTEQEARVVEILSRAGYEIPEDELTATFGYTIRRKAYTIPKKEEKPQPVMKTEPQTEEPANTEEGEMK